MTSLKGWQITTRRQRLGELARKTNHKSEIKNHKTSRTTWHTKSISSMLMIKGGAMRRAF